MKRFIEGEDRHQVTLLPECLDDFIDTDNTVRVVDVFIDELDLAALGFYGGKACCDGPPLVSPVGALEAVLVRLSQSHPVQPAP